jgi:hypothetical protein
VTTTPQGQRIYGRVALDVTALAAGLDGPGSISFERIAVTDEQIARLGLADKSDGIDKDGTLKVQLEAIDPLDLVGEVRRAIKERIDIDAAIAERDTERWTRIAALQSLRRSA